MINIFKKNAIIEYESGIEAYPNIISPAKNHIPDWYKKIPKWKNNQILELGKGFNNTVKQCMPVFDSLTSGYMILLSHDIYVKNNNGAPSLSWNNAKFPPKSRDTIADLNLLPAGHYPFEFLWQTGVATKIPNNYSMLITHPINRYDLPFTTLSGVVDGGFTMNAIGNIPFYVKQGFEGIIPQGTPIMQIIPFRRENWYAKIKNGLYKEGILNNEKTTLLIYGWYKKTFWRRKRYE